MHRLILVFVAVVFTATVQAGPAPRFTRPKPPGSFSTAKRIALRAIYKGHHTTFYCGCGFTSRKRVKPVKCGYKPRRVNARSRRIEWEHVVPASAFGKHRKCWRRKLCRKRSGKRYKGRRCCRKIDPQFKAMEADLVNLVPAVGELNGLRRDYRFGTVPGEPRIFGRCDFEIDRRRDTAEPPAMRRGEIARTYLYMHYSYPKGLPLTKAQIRRFLRWHRADPPDAWEKDRNKRIARVQGVGNTLVR